jgi:exopolysaccharide biosynthesis protein
MLVNFDNNVALQQEAQVMQAIGCHEAMNLDGGASRALASHGQILAPAGRLNLTSSRIVVILRLL